MHHNIYRHAIYRAGSMVLHHFQRSCTVIFPRLYSLHQFQKNNPTPEAWLFTSNQDSDMYFQLNLKAKQHATLMPIYNKSEKWRWIHSVQQDNLLKHGEEIKNISLCRMIEPTHQDICNTNSNTVRGKDITHQINDKNHTFIATYLAIWQINF